MREMSNKKCLRKTYLDIRSSLSETEVEKKSKIIIESLFSLDEFKSAHTIMFYVDTKKEVMTRQAITGALNMDKRVVVPKVVDHGMIAVEIDSLIRLKPGRLGIYEPIENNEMPVEQIDLVVVPGVVFDKRGFRIGYGGGYYDRFLPSLRPDARKVAIAYDIQLIDKLSTEDHDIRVDIIITEEFTYRF
jgi:5-formyltetrahydrofolate cyclo-ligase